MFKPSRSHHALAEYRTGLHFCFINTIARGGRVSSSDEFNEVTGVWVDPLSKINGGWLNDRHIRRNKAHFYAFYVEFVQNIKKYLKIV